MKQLFAFRQLFIIACSLFTSTFVSGQDLAMNTITLNRQLFSQTASHFVAFTGNTIGLAELKMTSPKVYRNFTREFRKAKEVLISQENGETFIYCKIDGIPNRIGYDAKGNWHHTIRYYDEADLDNSIRNTVLDNYRGFEIKGVTEVNVGDKTAYLVSIESKRMWKTIRLVDDTMEEFESFRK